MRASFPAATSGHKLCTPVPRLQCRAVLVPHLRRANRAHNSTQSYRCRHISSLARTCALPQQLKPARSVSRRPGRQRLQALAMVNIEFAQPALWLGMGLIGGGLALYQLRRLTPEISRDADVVVSSVAIFSGGILIFQGWRLDPLLLFCQLLTAGTALAWAVEAINLRKVVDNEQRFDERTRQYPPMEAPQLRDRGIPLPPPREQDFGRWYDQEVDRRYDVPAQSSGQEAGYLDEGGYYSNGTGGYEQEDPYDARSQEAYYGDSYSDQQDPGTSGDGTLYNERRGLSQRDGYPAGSTRRTGRDSQVGDSPYNGGERWSSSIEVGSQDDWD